MRKNQVVALILIIVIIMAGVVGCTATAEPSFDVSAINSYTEIPNVTDEEIAAIEVLKSSGRSFSYVSLLSREAFIRTDNTLAGFTPMFCKMLTELFEIPFVPRLEEWNILYNGLNDEIIDFTGELTPTPERMEYLFMTHPIAARSLALITKQDAPNIETEEDLNGMRIGFFRGSITAQSVFEAYQDLDIEVVDVINTGDAVEKLETGLIDAYIVETNHLNNSNTRLQPVFPFVYTPVAMTTANKELVPIISVINKYIEAGGVNKLFEMYSEGTDEFAKQVLYNSFSDEEKAYIHGLTAPVPIALETFRYPISFYDETSSEFQGVVLDLLEVISNLVGIEFEIVNDRGVPWGELLDMLRNGEAALISELLVTEERKGQFLWSDMPYFYSPLTFISRMDYPFLEMYQIEHTLTGVVSDSYYEHMYKLWFPGSENVVYYRSQDEGLDALERGEIDLYLSSEHSLLYQINFREKLGYKANYVIPIMTESRFGFNINEGVLCSIISKAMAFTEPDTIQRDWTSRVYDYSRVLAQQQATYMSVFGGAIFLILIVSIIFIFNSVQKKEVIVRQSLELQSALELNQSHLNKLSLVLKGSNVGTYDMEIVPEDPFNPSNTMIFSEELRQAFGFIDREEMPDNINTWLVLLHPDDKEAALNAFVNHVFDKSGKTPYSIEYRMMKKDGKYSYFHATGETVRDEWGNPLRVAGSLRDITEHKTLLERANAASKAKGDFLSTMSHEMRTPMNAIIGMTEIGKRAESAEDKNHALSRIDDASKYLLGVINDILDMAKIEANKLVLSPVEYDFKRMLQKVITLIRFRADKKQQTLMISVDNDVPSFVVGDDQRFAQIVTNLLSNAVKFTPERGEIHLDAALVGETDGVCELRIEVSDSGIGISAEQQKTLFTAFEQAQSGISREYAGTGLGLVISKRIIEIMGGRIWVESELGKGAKFVFTAKVRRGEKGSDSEPSVGESYEQSDKSDNFEIIDGEFAGKTMLFADDIEINREMVILLLEKTGLIIECAENGKEALDMMEANPGKYDIVLMDVRMPKMDGLESTRRIRALPAVQGSKLPIIAMTANVFKDDIETCLAAGMDCHLGKPLDISLVMEKLREYLNTDQ